MMMDIDIRDASEACESSTHTSTRMSAHKQRIEVITRGERRRRWSAGEKQAIVAESLASNVSVAGIARKHGIGTGQLYGWHNLTAYLYPHRSFRIVKIPHRPGVRT